MQASLVDRTSTETRDNTADVKFVQTSGRTNDVVGYNAADADLKRSVNNNRCFNLFKSREDFLLRERAIGFNTEKTDFLAVFTHFINNVFDGSNSGAKRDNHDLSVFCAIKVDESAGFSSDDFFKFFRNTVDDPQRLQMVRVCKIANFSERFGSNHGAD